MSESHPSSLNSVTLISSLYQPACLLPTHTLIVSTRRRPSPRDTSCHCADHLRHSVATAARYIQTMTASLMRRPFTPQAQRLGQVHSNMSGHWCQAATCLVDPTVRRCCVWTDTAGWKLLRVYECQAWLWNCCSTQCRRGSQLSFAYFYKGHKQHT